MSHERIMKYQEFIIDVPAGEGHQEFCTIFAGSIPPRGYEVRPAETDRRYGITISADLISDEALLGKLRVKDNKVNISSGLKPSVVLRNSDSELLDAIGTAEILETVFHDLHWVGLTPDRVVRYVRKRLLVMPYDYRNPRAKGIGLALLAVEMKTDDVDAALKQLSDEWRDLRSERFDAE